MLKLEKRADLEALHFGQIRESPTLEYKSSGAVEKSDPKKKEMAKDSLAFANAAGGQIIYGMKENKDHLPDGLDAGIDPVEFPGIWFEQVIQQSTSPPIEGLRVHDVPLEDGTGRVAVVVTIPAAQARAPHQAKDGRYYRRHNFGNLIMNDSEVRDTMRRATTPELFVRLSFPGGDKATLEYASQSEMSKPVILTAFVGNRSNQPAFHTLVQLGIDEDITILGQADFAGVGRRKDEDDVPQNWLRHRLSSPHFLPIFKEAEPTESRCSLGFHSQLLTRAHRFRITTLVQTPGYTATEQWVIHQEGPLLRLLEPGDPFAR
jgi:hypothetical protein